jgi:phosphoglycolate phosphatase-like HAD superfamily hydrolase
MMLTYADLNPDKKAVIFELDGVLYPERDFYLQIYYLFAHFVEYMETVPPADDLLQFLQTAYAHHGHEGIFERAVDAFGLHNKYRENLERLELTAQLPLKLELPEAMRVLLQDIVAGGKQLFIWTKGDAEGQLNKIRQTDWQGLAQHLRVYFDAEYPDGDALAVLLKENGLGAASVVMVGCRGELEATAAGIDFIRSEV